MVKPASGDTTVRLLVLSEESHGPQARQRFYNCPKMVFCMEKYIKEVKIITVIQYPKMALSVSISLGRHTGFLFQ